MHISVLAYQNFAYLKWALALTLGSVVLYFFHVPLPEANGGTWLGYVLGTIGALLILWLMWFGVRKRQYDKGAVKIEAWLSAHIYLGLALTVVATLHTGFQFGWNVHTLAYTLMMIVIASGVFGIYAYLRYPPLMTDNRGGETLDGLLEKLAETAATARDLAMERSDSVAAAVIKGTSDLKIGGSIWQQLKGRNDDCAAAAALEAVKAEARDATSEEARALRPLIALLGERVEIAEKARRDIRFKALFDIWLFLHVPLSIALLAALSTHVFSVFFYW